MELCLYLFGSLFLFVELAITLRTGPTDDMTEFCQFEDFEATCEKNQVVYMEKALYGRMNLGRCVKKDLGYVGACSIDVLEAMDQMCSGRHTCNFRVSTLNKYTRSSQQCLEELKFYLEAKYSCLDIISADKTKCWSSASVNVTAQSGYIASVASEDTGCGTNMAPWVVHLEPGQKINLTLIDFDRNVELDVEDKRLGVAPCRAYAVIRESGAKDAVTICGGSQRERHIYTSNSNRIEIRVITRKDAKRTNDFAIKFNAVGCPDIIKPNYWFERKSEKATVGCVGSDDRWELTCQGTEWKGNRGNCTAVYGASNGADNKNNLRIPMEYSVFVIIAIAVIISVIILMVGIFCLKRRNRNTPGVNNNQHQTIPKDDIVYDQTIYRTSASYKENYRTVGGGNEYACICEMPLPPPPFQNQQYSFAPPPISMGSSQLSYQQESDCRYPGPTTRGHGSTHQYGAQHSRDDRDLGDADHSDGLVEGHNYFTLDPDQSHKNNVAISSRQIIR